MKYLYFSASWCGPCRMLGPTMKKLADLFPVEKIDVDSGSELLEQYNIRSVPCVVLVEDETGRELSRTVGVKAEAHFINEWTEWNSVEK